MAPILPEGDLIARNCRTLVDDDSLRDGKPALDVANFYQEMVLSPLEAAASLAESSGEIVIKVVNFTERPQTTGIRLEGALKIEPEGTEIVLSSSSLDERREHHRTAAQGGSGDAQNVRVHAGVHANVRPPLTDHHAAEDRQDRCLGSSVRPDYDAATDQVEE
jgi:hypothetical protein